MWSMTTSWRLVPVGTAEHPLVVRDDRIEAIEHIAGGTWEGQAPPDWARSVIYTFDDWVWCPLTVAQVMNELRKAAE